MLPCGCSVASAPDRVVQPRVMSAPPSVERRKVQSCNIYQKGWRSITFQPPQATCFGLTNILRWHFCGFTHVQETTGSSSRLLLCWCALRRMSPNLFHCSPSRQIDNHKYKDWNDPLAAVVHSQHHTVMTSCDILTAHGHFNIIIHVFSTTTCQHVCCNKAKTTVTLRSLSWADDLINVWILHLYSLTHTTTVKELCYIQHFSTIKINYFGNLNLHIWLYLVLNLILILIPFSFTLNEQKHFFECLFILQRLHLCHIYLWKCSFRNYMTNTRTCTGQWCSHVYVKY